jgi:hypothetical protein
MDSRTPNVTDGDFFSVSSERGTLFIYTFTGSLNVRPSIYDFNL